MGLRFHFLYNNIFHEVLKFTLFYQTNVRVMDNTFSMFLRVVRKCSQLFIRFDVLWLGIKLALMLFLAGVNINELCCHLNYKQVLIGIASAYKTNSILLKSLVFYFSPLARNLNWSIVLNIPTSIIWFVSVQLFSLPHTTHSPSDRWCYWNKTLFVSQAEAPILISTHSQFE